MLPTDTAPAPTPADLADQLRRDLEVCSSLCWTEDVYTYCSDMARTRWPAAAQLALDLFAENEALAKERDQLRAENERLHADNLALAERLVICSRFLTRAAERRGLDAATVTELVRALGAEQ